MGPSAFADGPIVLDVLDYSPMNKFATRSGL